jgi:hypothetical protein
VTSRSTLAFAFAFAFALALAFALPSVAFAGSGRSWDEAFAVEGAGQVHLRARYRDAQGREHALELWRSGNLLRRDTDGKLALYVERRADHDDRYRVVDRARGVAYRARRSSLFRVGAFPDWASLASLLTRPRGVEQVTAPKVAPGETAFGRCRWYELSAPNATRRVCWSDRWRAPLLVTERAGAKWRPVLTVEQASADPIAPAVFTPPHDVTDVDVDHDVAPQD